MHFTLESQALEELNFIEGQCKIYHIRKQSINFKGLENKLTLLTTFITGSFSVLR